MAKSEICLAAAEPERSEQEISIMGRSTRCCATCCTVETMVLVTMVLVTMVLVSLQLCFVFIVTVFVLCFVQLSHFEVVWVLISHVPCVM